MLIILASIVLIFVLFFYVNSEPLTDKEVLRLASKRRNREIDNKYYFFKKEEIIPNPVFKKQMKATGKIYRIEESLHYFPSIAASLLKYKKHEWVIIGFEKNKMVNLIWLNKGVDRKSVEPYLSASDVEQIAKSEDYQAVLIFHNHPNPDPKHWDCTTPSIQDLISAEYYAEILNKSSINLLAFICERGKYYQFYSSYSDTFYPLQDFVDEINSINGQSRLNNFKLYLEMVFTW